MEEIPLDPTTTDLVATDAPTTETAEATEPPAEVVLSAEEQANLEKLRKRAERFGTTLNIPENFKTTPKAAPPRQNKRKEFLEAEKQKIESREKRFGLIPTKMRNDKHFDEKAENPVSDDNKQRPEALHLYGVDFLANPDITEYFKRYNPLKVEWINDSSCNIVFDSGDTAQKAYKELTLTKKYDSNWRETFPIEKDGVKFTLEVRFATEKDIKDPLKKEGDSSYFGFIIEQRKLRKEKETMNKGGRRDNRDREYYDRGSGVRNKRISKKGGKRGKGKNEEEEEENDLELKKLRQEQAAEAEQEATNEGNGNQAADGENGTQHEQVQESRNTAETVQAPTKETQDQDLDL